MSRFAVRRAGYLMFSDVNGLVSTSPPQAGASGSAVMSGTQSGSATFALDDTGGGSFKIQITVNGTYALDASVTSGGQTEFGLATVSTLADPERCPAP